VAIADDVLDQLTRDPSDLRFEVTNGGGRESGRYLPAVLVVVVPAGVRGQQLVARVRVHGHERVAVEEIGSLQDVSAHVVVGDHPEALRQGVEVLRSTVAQNLALLVLIARGAHRKVVELHYGAAHFAPVLDEVFGSL
jgi:hypothetical protein